jgi:hypothetical protein
MDMDDMFVADDEIVMPQEDEEEDDEDFIPASVRYKATDEAITREDEMEILYALAGEVEMVDDIGSLAQSLGASHLGRSLQLQAEIATRNNKPAVPPPDNHVEGVRISSPGPKPKGNAVGGLSSVIEKAKVEGLSDSFFQKRPVSAPRLDSFKMIKVIGKGSFGMFQC